MAVADPQHARLLATLAGFVVVLAGCAAPPQPAPTSATLSATPASAAAGALVNFTWEVQGGTGAITHSELHHGPSSIPDPDAGVYPGTAPGTGSAGRYTAQATLPATGDLFARAHVVGGGRTVWSNEARVEVLPPGPSFEDVRVPDAIEAGVPFQLRYRLEASGTSSHVGAHFSTESSAALSANFQPGEWSGQRPSQHLGAPQAVSLPLEVSVEVLVPAPGTWYLRPHLLLGSTHHWGAELTLQVVPPGTPNIVLVETPTTGIAGSPMPLRFQLNAQPGSSAHVGAHYSQESSASQPAGFPVANWTGARKAPHHGEASPVAIPGEFAVNITFPLPGTWHWRAHAIVGSANVWSHEVAVPVAAPAEPKVLIVEAPREHTVGASPLGLSVQPIQVEWAVLVPVPSSTNHTDVHHGPQSVAQPKERDPSSYPTSTAPQSGNLSALFKADVSAPAVQGPYHLRAMAILLDPDGQPSEVWSDEWVVQVRLRT